MRTLARCEALLYPHFGKYSILESRFQQRCEKRERLTLQQHRHCAFALLGSFQCFVISGSRVSGPFSFLLFPSCPPLFPLRFLSLFSPSFLHSPLLHSLLHSPPLPSQLCFSGAKLQFLRESRVMLSFSAVTERNRPPLPHPPLSPSPTLPPAFTIIF